MHIPLLTTSIKLAALALISISSVACSHRTPVKPPKSKSIVSNEAYIPSLALLRRGNQELKEVALTIDDGPHDKWAPAILKALRDNHVHATFFVVGKKVKEHPELVKQMLADGNEVGNHSMNHPRLDSISLAKVKDEIVECHKTVFQETGYRMKLLRPPGLRYTEDILKLGKSLGYTTVEENIAVGDFIVVGDHTWYENNPGFPAHVAKVRFNVFKQLKNGAIIVIHDMPATAAALDSILKGIAERGYKVVTASEMLAHLKNSPVKVGP